MQRLLVYECTFTKHLEEGGASCTVQKVHVSTNRDFSNKHRNKGQVLVDLPASQDPLEDAQGAFGPERYAAA